jgi:hypothetical protein
LGNEIRKLLYRTPMIQPTKELYDLKAGDYVINTERDNSYYIVCSTGKFDNPAPVISDPTVSTCNLCALF